MKSVFLVTFTTLFFTAAIAQQKINQRRFMAAPESVGSDGKYYYVSDLGKGGDPLAKDSDGMIWKVDLEGNIAADSIFATHLHGPKGNAVYNNTLFVIDINHLLGFDLKSGKKIYDIDMSSLGSSFMNDIAVKDDKTIFVSVTDKNKIMTVHLSGSPAFEELIVSDSVKGPNGIVYSKKEDRLYVVGFGTNFMPNGEIGYINLNGPKRHFTKLADRQGYYDGVGLLNEHTLVVSDWVAFEKRGVVFTVNIQSGEITYLNKELIAGPADFLVNRKKEIICPELMEGALLKISTK